MRKCCSSAVTDENMRQEEIKVLAQVHLTSECWNKKLDSGRLVPESCSTAHTIHIGHWITQISGFHRVNDPNNSLSLTVDKSGQKLAKQNVVNFKVHW